ncbi:PERF protein, partial [Amia calva]|nr:PERF protein [Amia calva]
MGSLCPLLLLPWALLSLCQPGIILGCHTGSKVECQKASFVPGYNLVGKGFDIVSMKWKGAYVIDVETWAMADGICQLCKNTQLGGNLQKVPDSVLDWRPRVNCLHSVTSKLYQSHESVLKDSTETTNDSWKLGLDLEQMDNKQVGGTYTEITKFATERSKSDKYSFSSNEVNCKIYSFHLKDQPPLNSEFLNTLHSLPKEYTSKTATKFQNFISTYGTHYIRQVELGGRVHSITALRTCESAMKGVRVNEINDCLRNEALDVVTGQPNKKLSDFSDRKTEVIGGLPGVHDIFSEGGSAEYTKWMNSLKTHPGIVSYDLRPLHMLVQENITQVNLKKAVRQYILNKALSLICSSPCKVGSHRDPANPCLCKCHGQTSIDADCCPSKPGLATLVVTVVRAVGLYGDQITNTDAYVKVFYGSQREQTQVITDNFPQWNKKFSFGLVDLSKSRAVQFEVWDQDSYYDDLLGKCQFELSRGEVTEKRCDLNHGSLYVSLSVECAPNLGGDHCQSYLPSPMSKEQAARYMGCNLMPTLEPFLSALQNQGWQRPANYTFGH